jgi:hypothetical protein
MSSASEISYLSERLAAIRIESFEVYVEACFADELHMKFIHMHKFKLLVREFSVLLATFESLVENGID